MVVSTALYDSVMQQSACIPANRWVSGSLFADCWVQGDGASVPKWMRQFPWKSDWGSVGLVYNLGQPSAHGMIGWELFVCIQYGDVRCIILYIHTFIAFHSVQWL